ncbi:uncharacterized protein LOC119578410 isoform X1 [Penaeus monodon]|uniref:uncharacterized protein LOC119578410 isoform X1 n=1 Tax=Penaeus monodon TaxID=6687 RepID=UPI0018A7B6B8|nr:uncharacterized protein LOC119578410 isoform X1 [Penaeus monodon]
MAEDTLTEQCGSIISSPYISLIEACISTEDAADKSALQDLFDSEYDIASQVCVAKMESKSPKMCKGAYLDRLKTVTRLLEKKNDVLTQELEELENSLLEEMKELKTLERKYEEESAIDEAMDSLFLLLPKNNILERGRKLEEIANKLSSSEMPQCEFNMKLLSKSMDSYISKLIVQNESLGAAMAEKRRKLHQLYCNIQADEDYQWLSTGNLAKLEKLTERLDVRHSEQVKEGQKQLKTLNKELSEVEMLANQAESACKALSSARHIE